MSKSEAIKLAVKASLVDPVLGEGLDVAKFEATLAQCGYRVSSASAPTLHSGPRSDRS